MRRNTVFIALEGGEGTGKSTQSQLLTQTMQANGYHALMVHEPGTTPLGVHLREYLKSKRRIDPEAELLLFEAGRAQLMSEIIRPSLEAGISIISDRFAASSIAYQGHGRHIGAHRVQALNDFATGNLYPDLNILLDMDPGESMDRTGDPQLQMELMGPRNPVRQDAPDSRRFEDQPMGFHQRVRRGYQEQVRNDPDHWAVINAAQSIENIQEQLWQLTRKLLEE